MNAAKHGPRPKLLPDEGATVDGHGRPPKAPSRTGPGSSPPADPARVERAGKEGTHRKAGAKLPADSGGERATCHGGPNGPEARAVGLRVSLSGLSTRCVRSGCVRLANTCTSRRGSAASAGPRTEATPLARTLPTPMGGTGSPPGSRRGPAAQGVRRPPWWFASAVSAGGAGGAGVQAVGTCGPGVGLGAGWWRHTQTAGLVP